MSDREALAALVRMTSHLDSHKAARVIGESDWLRSHDAAVLRPLEDLFAGGPDSPCRTTWHGGVEHVEVPIDALRQAFRQAGGPTL